MKGVIVLFVCLSVCPIDSSDFVCSFDLNLSSVYLLSCLPTSLSVTSVCLHVCL